MSELSSSSLLAKVWLLLRAAERRKQESKSHELTPARVQRVPSQAFVQLHSLLLAVWEAQNDMSGCYGSKGMSGLRMRREEWVV